jgi:hypothetical protein
MYDYRMAALGVSISAVAALLFVITWILMAKYPKILLGGVEGLWLRCLIRVVYAGLAIVILAVLNTMLGTILLRR